MLYYRTEDFFSEGGLCMKKKQSATGLFFSMFLRAIVVILAIVIVCLVVALVRSLIHNKGSKTNSTDASATTVATENQTDPLLTAEPTEATTEATTAAVDKTIKIIVLNGTSTNGVAGAWKEKLNNEGYNSVEAANYNGNVQTSLVWYKTPGVGADVAAFFTEPQVLENFEASNTDADITDADLIVVIGTKDDIVSN